MYKKITLLVLFALTLTSCDPLHVIVFENKTPDITHVILKMKPDAKNFDLMQQASEDKTITYTLQPAGKSANEGILDFGIGTWDDTEIQGIAAELESITIENKNTKTVYKSTDAITKLLSSDKEGFLYSTVLKVAIE